MRPEFMEPSVHLGAEELRDVLLVVCVDVPVDGIERWTEHERMLAYDWAAREHLHASDNPVRRRPMPSFIAASNAHLDLIDEMYRERAHLVAHLATTYPAWISTDLAEPDWPVVYVDTPAGQLSWHIAPRDMDLFEGVPRGLVPWDGHTTEQKYERLRKLTSDRRAQP
jgi:hypothetical protein